jgi:endonuclease/exonuclease/phosphatase family metal-dependent hydrolase
MSWTSKLFLFLNILLALATISCYFTPDIAPSKIWLFAFLALTYPILVFANIFFIVSWLFIDIKYIFISILTLALGYNHVSSYFGFRGGKISNNAHDISLVSYNISNALSGYDKSKNIKLLKAKKLEEFLSRFEDEDTISLQEVGSYASDIIKKPFSKYHIHKFDKGAVILSKHPIIKKGLIEFGTKTNSCLWADIVIDIDTIRIYNVHLQSNKISKDAEEMINNKNLDKEEAFSKISTIFRHYKNYHLTRKKQAIMVKEHADLSPYKVIICGDFNDVPLSYNYKVLQKNLIDTFKDKGAGSGSTFNGNIPFLRIDYILVHPSFKVSKFNIIKEKYSDHYPIATVIAINEQDPFKSKRSEKDKKIKEGSKDASDREADL